LRWTNYISADTPGDTGDWETLGPPDEKGRPGTIHHVRPDICTIPVRMECRTVQDKVAWYLPYEKITYPCNPLGKGFACENKKQKNGKCRDYEARVLCFYAREGYDDCSCLRWSNWFDNDDPNDHGDEELIGRKLPRYVCPGGYQPVDVECTTVTGLDVFHAGNKKVQCDLQGVACYNEDQGRNCRCHDYRVRFLCPSYPANYPIQEHKYDHGYGNHSGDYGRNEAGYHEDDRYGGRPGGGYKDDRQYGSHPNEGYGGPYGGGPPPYNNSQPGGGPYNGSTNGSYPGGAPGGMPGGFNINERIGGEFSRLSMPIFGGARPGGGGGGGSPPQYSNNEKREEPELDVQSFKDALKAGGKDNFDDSQESYKYESDNEYNGNYNDEPPRNAKN